MAMFSYIPETGMPSDERHKLYFDPMIHSLIKQDLEVPYNDLVGEIKNLAEGRLICISFYENLISADHETDMYEKRPLVIIESDNFWWSFEKSKKNGITIQRSSDEKTLWEIYRRKKRAGQIVRKLSERKLRSRSCKINLKIFRCTTVFMELPAKTIYFPMTECKGLSVVSTAYLNLSNIVGELLHSSDYEESVNRFLRSEKIDNNLLDLTNAFRDFRSH